MTTSTTPVDIQPLRNRWGSYLVLSICMIVLGIIALAYVPAATIGTVLILGWLMIFSGIIEAIHAFRARPWGGVFLHLMAGVLGLLIGLLIVTHPLAGALAWTMLLAAFLTVIGLFRTIAAIHLRFRTWGWAVFDGVVTVILGILLWAQWPFSAMWFLGFALGVALVLRGWTTLRFALAIRELAQVVSARKASA